MKIKTILCGLSLVLIAAACNPRVTTHAIKDSSAVVIAPVLPPVPCDTFFDTAYVVRPGLLDSLSWLSKRSDSIARVNRILGQKLLVAEFKVRRITYYNKLAASPSQLQFLRGWINRVLAGGE